MGVSNPRNIGGHLQCAATASGNVQLQGNLPQSSSGSTVASAAIDRSKAGYPQSCVLKNAFAAASGSPTTASITTTLTHCATSGGTYTAYTQPSGVAAATGADTTAAAGAHYFNVDLSGALQFLKTSTVVAFTGGTSPAMIFSDEVVFGGLSIEPSNGNAANA